MGLALTFRQTEVDVGQMADSHFGDLAYERNAAAAKANKQEMELETCVHNAFNCNVLEHSCAASSPLPYYISLSGGHNYGFGKAIY